MKPVRALTLSAVLTALGLLLLVLGALLDILDLAMVMVASFFVTLLMVEAKGIWPFLVWIGTSLLSLLFLPGRFVTLEYAFFGGVWPILKYYFEKLPKLPSFLLKFVSANLLFFGAVSLGFAFFGLEMPESLMIKAVTVLLWEAVWIIYDFLLTRLILVWCFKYRSRFSRFFR